MTDPDEWDQESGQLGVEDTLDDRGIADPLDEGVSPAERPWVGAGWGVTAREDAGHESLDGRLARELPELVADEGDGLGDVSDTDGELWDDEVGDVRAGRLLAGREGDACAEVDLLIRAGGEKRLSDFLLWESAYAELCFVDTLWPDFGAADLSAAIADFRGRERRFGGLNGIGQLAAAQ